MLDADVRQLLTNANLLNPDGTPTTLLVELAASQKGGRPGLDGETLEPMMIPGPPGADGAIGPAGPPGSGSGGGGSGMLLALDGDTIEPMMMPGQQGPQGTAGSSGAPGTDGAAGVAGPTGPIGLTGAQGFDGETIEPLMIPGLTGSTGAQGIQGFTGGTGTNGPPGLPGLDGETIELMPPFAGYGDSGNTYRVIVDASGSHIAGKVAGTYGMGQGDPLAVTGTGTLYPLKIIYLAIADYPGLNGLATKLRIRVSIQANDVAPYTGTFIVGLHPVTRPAVSGGTGVCIYTLGAAVSGSTVTFTNVAADSANSGVGSDFAFPTDGFYVIGVVTNQTMATNSHVHISAALQLRN